MPSLTHISLLFLISVVQADGISFNRDVRPILADKCFHCHGPDSATREAGLRLDTEESAKGPRDGGFVITPGNTETSLLVERILSHDSDLRMPPPDSRRTLSIQEKQILVDWIHDGANWQQHWSFIAPVTPELPNVVQSDWPRNSIDRFVLRRLEDAGITPSPAAPDNKWLRRVSLDLTGLPPTLHELDSFLADRSATAYERVVDRLLSSPAYGEHMAASWLDAARYADTDGYQNDGPRTMFRYRDWVIDAFNENMPFDQFTIEQLAGDLLPDATVSQQIATGFNRNHRYNSEAGLVLDEFLLENAVDRVDTTSTVWMGLTMGCARCHDHKYDPFTQREYYQMISFFDNIDESGRAIKFGNSEPWISAPTESQRQRLKELEAQLADAEKQLRRTHELFAKATTEEIGLIRAMTSDPCSIPLVSDGLTHCFLFENRQKESIKVEKGGPVLRDGFEGLSATTGGNGILDLGTVGDISCHRRCTLSFWLKPNDVRSGVVISRQTMSTTRPGFCVILKDGHLQFRIVTRWLSGVGTVQTQDTLPAGEWTHVTLTNDGTQRAAGQQIWINGLPADVSIVHNTNSNTGGTNKSARLRIGGGVVGDLFHGQVDNLHFFDRSLHADEIAILAERRSIVDILDTTQDARSSGDQKKLFAWTAEVVASRPDVGWPTSIKLAARSLAAYNRLRAQRTKLLDSFPTTMVMKERSRDTGTTIRIRGVYDAHGDVVESGTPSALPAMPTGKRRTRHELARWLVSDDHPLTARVIVNRYWQHYFGQGLVTTPEDFGSQGNLPSHPELLDWLARDFIDGGWDVKDMQKKIALSATYRQDSSIRSTTRQDLHPATSPNLSRLFHRGPRQRLTARQLRDQALFVSGLLNTDIGGPSVSPYQPANLWEEMSNMKYRQSTGKDLYRRGVYTIWKRTVAPPGLAILDAADRENCSVRPKRTNTPLQALALLNDKTYVEAARHLAVRMHREGGDYPIRFAFRLLTCRHPADPELFALRQARQRFLSDFSARPDAAAKLLDVGEHKTKSPLGAIPLAADTMLCNVLLNLDEVVSKE